jgi:hypothetical protein
MFNLFKWSANQQTDEQILPPPPPPPPPVPTTIAGDGAKNAAQSLDVLSTLQRIENKLDILLKKVDRSESKWKKINMDHDSTNTVHAEDVIHSAKLPISKETDSFVAELMKKVEERKIAKHMGASHGFASVAEAIQFTMDQANTPI